MIPAILISALSLFVTLKWGSARLRFPLAVYTVIYLVTTVIGATWVAMQQDYTLWAILGGGLDTTYLRSLGDAKYWFLLYSPFVIPPLVMLFLDRRAGHKGFPALEPMLRARVHPLAHALLFLGLSGYCLFALFAQGLVNLGAVLSAQGDYGTLMGLRTHIFVTAGRAFFGLVYIGLPALAHVALFKTLRGGGLRWLLLLIFDVLAISVLVLLTIQKGILIIFLLALAIGFSLLQRRRLWPLLLGAASGLGVLTLLQSYFSAGAWGLIQSVSLVLFRMASGFPYYVTLYPSVLPYSGIDLGLDLIGIGSKNTESFDVARYMDPTVSWGQGEAAAAAHVVAYCQGGIPFAIVTLILCGVFLHWVSRLEAYLDSPLGYALYVQGLVFAYYLTQTTLRGAFTTGYGIMWAVGCLALLLLSSKWIRLVLSPAPAWQGQSQQ